MRGSIDKRYPLTTESGIEWIGEIPTHWGKTKVGNIYDITLGKMVQPKSNSEKDFLVPYLKAMNVQDGYINTDEVDNMFATEIELQKFSIKKGDILVCEGGEVARSAVVQEDYHGFVFQNSLHRVREQGKGVNVFLHYLLNAVRNSGFINILVNKATIAHFTKEKFSSLKICVPPIEEQRAITSFLNERTSEIDSLIADKEKLIELLEEKRQAIITEVVTKGLNPNVKMKNSGVEWIGEIPEHWEEKKIKYLFYETNDRNFSEDVELLSLFTSIGVKPRREMEDKGNKSQTVMNYKVVKKGDIVVNKLLAWMGSVGISEYEGVTSPDYDVYRPLNEKLIHNNFYHYYFRNHYFKGDCYKYGRGIMLMRWRTYPEQFKSILVPVPPFKEQMDIDTMSRNWTH